MCSWGLERGPLSLVSTTEELLDRKSSGSCPENWEYGRRDPSRWPHGTLYPQNLAITSPTSGGRSVGIVCSRTQTIDFFLNMFMNRRITQMCTALFVFFQNSIVEIEVEVEVKSHYDGQSVGQLVLVSCPSWSRWPDVTFLFDPALATYRVYCRCSGHTYSLQIRVEASALFQFSG
jgi:hypothetical protein